MEYHILLTSPSLGVPKSPGQYRLLSSTASWISTVSWVPPPPEAPVSFPPLCFRHYYLLEHHPVLSTIISRTTILPGLPVAWSTSVSQNTIFPGHYHLLDPISPGAPAFLEHELSWNTILPRHHNFPEHHCLLQHHHLPVHHLLSTTVPGTTLSAGSLCLPYTTVSQSGPWPGHHRRTAQRPRP